MTQRALSIGLLAGLATLLPGIGAAQTMGTRIQETKLADGIYMLEGRGGNMGLSVGPDGAFLIDDQFGELSGLIQKKIAELTDQPLRFLVNTHWHGDHTGGNENFAKAGAIIVAHDNVRKRMSAGQLMKAFGRQVPPAPPKALPLVTFTSGVTLHLNGQSIRVVHLPPAHTDGDSLVYFEEANVLHMGDVYFNGLYPFIDAGSGGHIAGVIAAVEKALPLANDQTRIIPGHGPVSDIAGLREYHLMLKTVHERLAQHLAAGKTTEEIVALKPTSDFDEKWGTGFLKPDPWVGIVVAGMIDQRDAATPDSKGK